MAEREKHFASGHLPYDPRCEVCSSCKKPNVPHVKSHESERTIPLLVGDYGCVKDCMDVDNVTVCGIDQADHDAQVEKWLAACKKYNINLNNKKSILSAHLITILGYIH